MIETVPTSRGFVSTVRWPPHYLAMILRGLPKTTLSICTMQIRSEMRPSQSQQLTLKRLRLQKCWQDSIAERPNSGNIPPRPSHLRCAENGFHVACFNRIIADSFIVVLSTGPSGAWKRCASGRANALSHVGTAHWPGIPWAAGCGRRSIASISSQTQSGKSSSGGSSQI